MSSSFKLRNRKKRGCSAPLRRGSSDKDEVAVTIDEGNNIIQVAKMIKKRGGVGPIRVHLSNDESDSINRTRNKSAKLLEYLSK